MLKINVKPDDSMNSNKPYDRLFNNVIKKNSKPRFPL
jgi:hypothetical protein